MATDNTPPRLRLIATIAVIVVITLVGLDFVLKGYYAYMSDEAHREKLAPLTARMDQDKAEQAAMGAAKLPIDQAMAQLKGPRAALVEPKPSEDMGAMTGWSKLPKQPPLPAPGAAHPPTTPGHDGHDMAAGDAGAHAAGDAGAHAAGDAGVHAATDAGAPAPRAPVTPKDAGARAPH